MEDVWQADVRLSGSNPLTLFWGSRIFIDQNFVNRAKCDSKRNFLSNELAISSQTESAVLIRDDFEWHRDLKLLNSLVLWIFRRWHDRCLENRWSGRISHL